MADTFKSVKFSTIATAFALAHRYADKAETRAETLRFREVARLIWDACGESGPMPGVLPANLQALTVPANEVDRSRSASPEAQTK